MPDKGLPMPRRNGHVAHCTCYDCKYGERDELRANVQDLQARLHAAETLTRTHEDATTRVRAENQKLKDRVVQVRVTHEECEVRCDAARVEITRLRRECVLHASRLSWDDLPNLTPGEMRHRAHAVMAKLRALATEQPEPQHARLTAPIESGYKPTQLDPQPEGEEK